MVYNRSGGQNLSALSHSAVQCSAVQCKNGQLPARAGGADGRPGGSAWWKAGSAHALHCTALFCPALHYSALHCTSLYCTALHYSGMHYSAMFSSAMLCTALYCSALHCTALHCACAAAAASESGAARPVSLRGRPGALPAGGLSRGGQIGKSHLWFGQQRGRDGGRLSFGARAQLQFSAEQFSAVSGEEALGTASRHV
jgi:hypothetical protein